MLVAHKAYPHTFYIPAAIVYAVLFIVPTGMAFFFSLTRWSLFDWEFIGLDNYLLFFKPTRPDHEHAQHAGLCGGDQRPEGRPRAIARRSLHFHDPLARPS